MQDDLNKVIQYFVNWNKLKFKIHVSRNRSPLYYKERQIWWASMGQNIGDEQNGKNMNFERPVLILKKFNAGMFLAVPISTQIKIGDYRYVFDGSDFKQLANLSQMRVMSSKRLLRRLSSMKVVDFENIKQMFRKML